MLASIIRFSIRNKFIVLLITLFIIGFGIYSTSQLSIGAVPDITNNQVQVITTSQNLSTQDIEQFITYPIELEMANLPGVKEIRSVSKFGLSVVTIVFEESMGNFLPRQLIAEKIKEASEKIPKNFGTPEMGPITTGLGEIYQYILDVEEDYKGQYSVMDLRTIQDWIVRRQLSGIPGVVEINTWGGYLKQYEVALNSAKLNAMNIRVSDVFTAIEKNNSVSGGAYIEKGKETYFIRGEGLISSLEELEQVVVENRDGIPIYIKDIASVGFGHANRFGAITANAEGEKVLGQVMMLKGANSKNVIEDVKHRIEEISKNLPEGIIINGFLDRSELISKTTFTISENLILGCLIVIFIVVLLLGNLRSGLLVASIIPLSLLFALSMMYLFGVDANLMSLGAIDFGIIIDGAVIIVEYVAFQLTIRNKDFKNLSKTEQLKLKETISENASSKMMNSAIFGQLIILIVFIPIFSLQGVEGKMFQPMALTFSFALIGAMLLCLTYVPVAASIFLKSTKENKRNSSHRIMSFLNRIYEPAIWWALKHKKIVLTASIILLIGAVGLFNRMGGEFVPTLDEGDFVIQPVLKTGTSLEETIKMTTKIEQILIDNFPEVKQVVTRIGAAEVPTDPMSMEESDVMITLNDKDSWTSASSKDELAELFKEKLAILGIELEFTQPIEMRFNGVRADVAIKLFGEDLEILAQKANEIKSLIEGVEGAADIVVEKTVGLPQMTVNYQREKIARYGLNIADLNEVMSMAFAGKIVGNVFEGEKRFDLVVRMEESGRQGIDDLRNFYIDLPNGGKIPLMELAEIKIQKGAAKISRDDTKRRIVVGINVRERDLQSVVDDVRLILDKKLELPYGYSITYGGQFENLQSAKARLTIAVPVALILIFILLYFAFKSFRDALLIYSAIPLSAVGGVILLYLRDLPFSISAGVGFIALFGIAVLNGIVLIEHFKELNRTSSISGDQLIVNGAKDRLRAVLLTASAAALGFLPMAISENVGAEVQRPLATVVIGGLISATLLTLLVLPVLYSMFNSSTSNSSSIGKGKFVSILFLLLMISSSGLSAQEIKSYEELRNLAYENNAVLKAASYQVDQSKALIKSAFDFNKSSIYYSYDENDLAFNNQPNYKFGIQQDFLFPTVYFADKKLKEAELQVQTGFFEVKKLQIEKELQASYQQVIYEMEKATIYAYLDSLYKQFSQAAKRRHELGESNYLEKITAESKQQQMSVAYLQAQQDIITSMERLKSIVQTDEVFELASVELAKIELNIESIQESPVLNLYENQLKRSELATRFSRQQLLPDISLDYFQGTNSGIDEQLIGYQIGLKIPILFGGQASKIKAAKLEQNIISERARDYKLQMRSQYNSLISRLEKFREALTYYEGNGELLSEQIIKTATRSYQEGEIDFFQYIQSLENATSIKLNYLENLNSYNQVVIQINHLTL